MSQCPMHALLDFERFSHGTPRELINRLREQHRILWETDDYSGGHWLLFRQEDIDHVLKTGAVHEQLQPDPRRLSARDPRRAAAEHDIHGPARAPQVPLAGRLRLPA